MTVVDKVVAGVLITGCASYSPTYTMINLQLKLSQSGAWKDVQRGEIHGECHQHGKGLKFNAFASPRRELGAICT